MRRLWSLICHVGHFILCDHKFYRRHVGGSWYKISDIDSQTGMNSAAEYWVRDPIADWPIIKEEKYPLKNAAWKQE
jgi:hypothetical protein